MEILTESITVGEMEAPSALPPRPYSETYQPNFEDQVELNEAKAELSTMTGITNRENIDGLKTHFAQIATGELDQPVVILGECHENISKLNDSGESGLQSHIDRTKKLLHTLGFSKLRRAIPIVRNRGQNFKPRSSEHEKHLDENSNPIPSFYGDGINGLALDDRTPVPQRMVEAAIQARAIEEQLAEDLDGKHVYAAHEALLLDYEDSFIRNQMDMLVGRKLVTEGETDDTDSKNYLLSADLPWIGARTADPDGLHVEMLSKIENPIGIKVGPDATSEDIRRLSEKLNPNEEAGKLVFMIRLGVKVIEDKNPEKLGELLDAINEYSPNSILMSDPMHGNTTTMPNGKKTRLVGNIIKEVKLVASAALERGMKLHGIHLEATGTSIKKQCSDVEGEILDHDSPVDPQLNLYQTLRVLNEVSADLMPQNPSLN